MGALVPLVFSGFLNVLMQTEAPVTTLKLKKKIVLGRARSLMKGDPQVSILLKIKNFKNIKKTHMKIKNSKVPENTPDIKVS